MAVEVANRKDVSPATRGNPVVQFFRSLNQFYHEVQDEMRKVTWPDRAQLKDTTIKIIIFVLFIGAVIGAIDLILQLILVQGIPSLFSRK
jgi:preprotein translocase subunit SecE